MRWPPGPDETTGKAFVGTVRRRFHGGLGPTKLATPIIDLLRSSCWCGRDMDTQAAREYSHPVRSASTIARNCREAGLLGAPDNSREHREACFWMRPSSDLGAGCPSNTLRLLHRAQRSTFRPIRSMTPLSFPNISDWLALLLEGRGHKPAPLACRRIRPNCILALTQTGVAGDVSELTLPSRTKRCS